MSYFVYQATFLIDLGVKRYYIGYSRCDPSLRERSLQQPGEYQPAWLSAGCHHFDFCIQHKNIESLAAALVVEAFATAQKWKSSPGKTRGGPWLQALVLNFRFGKRYSSLGGS